MFLGNQCLKRLRKFPKVQSKNSIIFLDKFILKIYWRFADKEQYVPIISDSEDSDSDGESQADASEKAQMKPLTRCGTRKLPALPLRKYRIEWEILKQVLQKNGDANFDLYRVLKQNQAMIKQLGEELKNKTQFKQVNKDAIKVWAELFEPIFRKLSFFCYF